MLGAPDTRLLGRFYRRLLGWDVVCDEPDWIMLRPPGGGTGLSFQTQEGLFLRRGLRARVSSR